MSTKRKAKAPIPKAPPNTDYDYMETCFPFNLQDELRVMANYKEGELREGAENRIIARALLHLGAKLKSMTT